MQDNLNLILDLFRKIQEGESLSVVEAFAVAGAIGAILGSLLTFITIGYYVYKTSKWSVSLLSFSKSYSAIIGNAINRLTSDEAWLSETHPYKYVYAGPLTIGIDIRSLLARLFTGNGSTIKIDGADIDHMTKKERKTILSVARQVRKNLIKKKIAESRFASANKLSIVCESKPEKGDPEPVEVDQKFIETGEILEMLRKRYGVNLSENNKSDSVPF